VFILAALLLAMGSPYLRASAARPAATAPDLGTAESFGVLGGSTVTNTGDTVVNGDLGVWPGLAVTGFPPGVVTPPGAIHQGDAVAQQAQSDVTAAYNDLAGQACDTVLTDTDLGGLTLTPGVYCFATSAQLTGDLTLNLEGDPLAVFVFQIGSTLTTATGSSVAFSNGGPGCNVFWQVGSSATLGTGTDFAGTIVALTSATLDTGADVTGRVLARNAAVTLDDNSITPLICSSLAVFLTSFSAEPNHDAIRVEWETVSELTNTGFNLYRGTSANGADRALLAFVPSQALAATWAPATAMTTPA
jgi:hypothetical protein